MAGFKTHITVSSLLGVGYGGAAYLMYGVPWPTCALAAGLCGVSGMLPDIDSDSGTPLHESMAFAAAVVPMMLLHRFQMGKDSKSMHGQQRSLVTVLCHFPHQFHILMPYAK